MTRSWQLPVMVVAVAIVVSGCGLFSQSSSLPLGDVELASITPPGTELVIQRRELCDPAVPGYYASGYTDLGVSDIHQWYLDRFEPTQAEATARFNAQPGLREPLLIFDTFHVWAASSGGNEQGATHLWVRTYATTQHDCLPPDVDQWNLTDAWSRPNPCNPDQILVDLWGVTYHEAEPRHPSGSSPILTFDGERMIAHGLDNLAVIHVLDGPSAQWTEYERGDCAVD